MRIYISGITGTGMGPLALMAKAAGFEVSGSDLVAGAIYDELKKAGIKVSVGEQDGKFLQERLAEGVDWFVYTSALSADHPELVMALESGVKCTKRDDFTAFLVSELGLKMVAVAGTHGKTTTTAMIVWAGLKLGLPVSYIVGTTLGFASSGAYHKGDKYFIYEADEYDRNFLKYHPWVAVIPAVSYDHPDIYKTPEEYKEAFVQFEEQSERIFKYDDGCVVEQNKKSVYGDEEFMSSISEEDFRLAGAVRRNDAVLAAEVALAMVFDNAEDDYYYYFEGGIDKVIGILDEFPGVGRRFERICDGVYTDYAHHPEEIAATMEIAQEEAKNTGRKGVVVVYQPHQNIRQHEVRKDYREAFMGAEKIYWLPTYLTRENPDLEVISPEEFINDLVNSEVAEAVELDDDLADQLRKYVDDGYLVILMTAGPADEWFRNVFKG